MTAKREGQQVDTFPSQMYGKDADGNVVPIKVTTDGSVNVDTKNVSSATNTKVNVGNTSTPVLSANTNRVQFIIVNDSDEDIYISYSDTAVLGEGIKLAKGGSITETNYVGQVSGICSSGNKNITVCEL